MKKKPVKIKGKEFQDKGQTNIVYSSGRVWLNGEEVSRYKQPPKREYVSNKERLT